MNFRTRSLPEPKGFLIAPMVDILLVLLGFFMLTWTFARYETELDVQVPTAKQGKESRRSLGEVIINITSDGTIIVNHHPMSPQELKTMLQKISSLYPDQAIILRGDSHVDYAHIIEALDLCRAANIWNVAFATANPSTPTANPSTPTANPSTPTTNPSTPTTNPSTPTTNPSTPTTNPSTPTTNPSTPTTNPSRANSNSNTPTSNQEPSTSNSSKITVEATQSSSSQ